MTTCALQTSLEPLLRNAIVLSLGVALSYFAISRWWIQAGPHAHDWGKRDERISPATLIRHAIGTRLNAIEYILRVLHSSPKPILWTRILGKKIILVRPSLDHELARHSKDISLASFASITLCKPVFNLSDAGVSSLRQIDTRPSWHAEFLDHNRGKAAMAAALQYVETAFQKFDGETEIDLGAWLFTISAGATAYSLYGTETPWLSNDLMDDFYEFQRIFESLYLPLSSLTAPDAHRLRKTLLRKLRAYHTQHTIIRPENLAHRLNFITSTFPFDTWHTNPDYYVIELVTALAILPTVGNITIWLVRHILARPEILSAAHSEVQKLVTSTNEGNAVDLGQLRQGCPLLVASWYETLRLHMTGVPREAVGDFELSGGEKVQRGDIIFLPMTGANRNAEIWERPGEFLPERFIGDDGKVAYALTRKVKTFGVAGNLCPGRYHAFGVIMAVVVTVFVTLDLHEPEGGWAEPVAATSVSGGGFDRCEYDVKARMAKKEGWSRKGLILNFAGNMFRS